MKTYRFADSKVYDPSSPESLELQRKFASDFPRQHGIQIGLGKVADALNTLEDNYRAEDHGQYREGFGSGYRAALADIRGKILEMLRTTK